MVQIVHGCKGTTSLVGGVHNFINSFEDLVNRNTANDMIFSVMIAYLIFYLDRKNFVGMFISLISLPAVLKKLKLFKKMNHGFTPHTLTHTHTHTQNMVNIFVLANFPHGCRVLYSARSSPFGSVQSILRGSDGMPHIVLQTVEPLLLGSSTWSLAMRLKVSLRQVMLLGGHLWNASRAFKCSSYHFVWGNIKFSKTVH